MKAISVGLFDPLFLHCRSHCIEARHLGTGFASSLASLTGQGVAALAGLLGGVAPS